MYEGGIRVPFIANWPTKIKSGSQTEHLSAQYDVMATLSELTGFELESGNDGISFMPTLLGKDKQEQHEFLLWVYPEYGGQVAIRFGDWKVVRQHLKDKQTPTLELYNLRTDPQELANVAANHPELLRQAAKIFEEQHETAFLQNFRIPILEKGLY